MADDEPPIRIVMYYNFQIDEPGGPPQVPDSRLVRVSIKDKRGKINNVLLGADKGAKGCPIKVAEGTAAATNEGYEFRAELDVEDIKKNWVSVKEAAKHEHPILIGAVMIDPDPDPGPPRPKHGIVILAKRKKWQLSCQGTAGAFAGIGGMTAGFTLTDMESGKWKILSFTAGGAGLGAGGAYAWPSAPWPLSHLQASGEFETDEHVTWNSFNCWGEIGQVAADLFVIGYSIAAAKFGPISTKPRAINFSGFQSFGLELSAGLVYGSWSIKDPVSR